MEFKDYINSITKGTKIQDVAESNIDLEDFEDNTPWTKEELIEFISDLQDDEIEDIGNVIYDYIMYNDETDDYDSFEDDDYDDIDEAAKGAEKAVDLQKCGKTDPEDPRENEENAAKGICDNQAGKNKKEKTNESEDEEEDIEELEVTDFDVTQYEDNEEISETKFFDIKKRQLDQQKKKHVADRKRKSKLLHRYYQKNKARIARAHKIYRKKAKRNPNKIRKHKA